MDPSSYSRPLPPPGTSAPLPLRVVESDVDLYWQIALELYLTIESFAERDESCSIIVPVGPVFQYRRFVDLMGRRPIDLGKTHLFFMDEYLLDRATPIPESDPLSFRGFIRSELIEPLGSLLPSGNVNFPDPTDADSYDAKLEALGGADLCVAGVGINGHVAFNEPPEKGSPMSDAEFGRLPTRVVELTRETIAINSNTALGGAYEQIPRLAVTVGMRQILSAARVRIYLNRPWQRAVLRKLLYGEVGATFPVSLLRRHPNASVMATAEVAQQPKFGLR